MVEELLHLMAAKRSKSHSPLSMWSFLGCPCSYGWPHEQIDTTNWIQEIIDSNCLKEHEIRKEMEGGALRVVRGR